MKKCFFALGMMLMFFKGFSQENKTTKQFYTELGGPGVLFSANFDSRFTAKSPFGWGYRVGLGFTIREEDSFDSQGGFNTSTTSIPTMPLGINYVLGKETSPHTFEIGAGTTILFKKTELFNWNNNTKAGNLLGFMSFMYRKQPANGGFTWRIGFTPIISTGGDIVPFGGGGLGFAF